MSKTTAKIWIWLDGTTLIKAVYNPLNHTLTILDETERILLKRIGITAEQAYQLAAKLAVIGAKRMDGNSEPFTYL